MRSDGFLARHATLPAAHAVLLLVAFAMALSPPHRLSIPVFKAPRARLQSLAPILLGNGSCVRDAEHLEPPHLRCI